MSKFYINVAMPEYRGAPMPEFNERSLNESRILDAERAKECEIYFDKSKNIGVCKWMTQASERPSDQFFAEVKRVFKAVGVPVGTAIEIEYGIRDNGWDNMLSYECIVD